MSHKASNNSKGKYECYPPDDCNVMINCIPTDITCSQLQSLFSPFGSVIDCHIVKDCSGNSRGFGFVKFSEPSAAWSAMAQMNGYRIGVKRLKVHRADERVPDGFQYYLSGFPGNMTARDLFHLLLPFGPVVQVRVLPPKFPTRGIGFVSFPSQEPGDRIVAATREITSPVFGWSVRLSDCQLRKTHHRGGDKTGVPRSASGSLDSGSTSSGSMTPPALPEPSVMGVSTLLAAHIRSNVGDAQLRVLLSQFGDLSYMKSIPMPGNTKCLVVDMVNAHAACKALPELSALLAEPDTPLTSVVLPDTAADAQVAVSYLEGLFA
eukprot:NODE_421_length_1520_cov_70.309404_g389_i0.p1 GENE.NODE_421_length_1520_cov_70.309404_g389_i0~~NODE_421_length_1520_cov_70.309404_g389_i0.p1  ORF type:complete len:321 (-),score=41.38 NODE_421_length_1520_cov_70.309404_g389_i0:486-1448(-)